jgi:glycosyltransferase involved in cell wall biosynthesis
MGRKTIIITGLPIFAKKMRDDLASFDANNRYVVLNTYYSKWDKILFICWLPFSSLVISLNGVSDRSRSLDWVIRFRKKLIMQWMGTDALLAMERYKKGVIFRKYLDYATHFVDSPWQQEEVKSLDLPIQIVPFKYGREIIPVERYEKMYVLTYIAAIRKVFYGWESVKAAANAFPSVEFRVVGMESDEAKFPSNIRLMGWLDAQNMAEELRNAPIFLRMTEHDGFSVSVIEALSVGAEVIWTHPSDCIHFVQNDAEMNHKLTEVFKLIEDRNSIPNKETIEFCNKTYNRQLLMVNYISELQKIMST